MLASHREIPHEWINFAVGTLQKWTGANATFIAGHGIDDIVLMATV